jgi:anti-sigma factor RsiW
VNARTNPEPGLSITCQEVVELVTDYLEGALDPAQTAEIEAHLGLCAGCARYLEQMQATIRVLGRVPVETLSDEARDDLLRAFTARPPEALEG